MHHVNQFPGPLSLPIVGSAFRVLKRSPEGQSKLKRINSKNAKAALV